MIARGEPGYPASLLDLAQPPRQLHTLGNVTALEASANRAVAIVGTRDATSYGIRVARSLAQAFVEAGAVVVSGMARGIDAAAHDGALAAGGTTVAVLGTGVDVPYPVGNRALHRAVAERGLVVSESPDGTRAKPGCFPRRNRIIAALSKLTIVVEAGFKSGALNTANQATDIGRAVAAVPGPMDSPRSAGCNTLIRDGAQIITSIDDAIALLGMSKRRTLKQLPLGPAEAEVWDAIGRGVDTVDGISAASGLGGRQVLEAIGQLEVAGLVTVGGDGRVAPSIVTTCEVVSA
ncbi:MAG TPA: DNA-processing protein DprA [Gemmatimonadaceae bacterium]|nr:DNA-processing protein DprA [Gemmatimonadaceae bacterium]